VEGGDARTILKTHDGAIEAVRTLRWCSAREQGPSRTPRLEDCPGFNTQPLSRLHDGARDMAYPISSIIDAVTC
jgi:hypothetical protein